MITRITSIPELKGILAEILFNNTSLVTKISDGSVLNGILYGNAKVAQKALKDIALIESHLFPDSAFGSHLDAVAAMHGIASRFGASGSSTYVRLVGDPGTQYLVSTHTVSGTNGLTFTLDEDTTIGPHGFTYAKVRSNDIGSTTNVSPLSLNKLTITPTGHKYVVNEYGAIGGRDFEQDDVFRKRIKDGANLAATGTVAMIEQVFMKINSNVLRVIYQGINSSSQVKLAVIAQNGIDFTQAEFDDILLQGQDFFNMRDLRPSNSQLYGVELVNIDYQPIDVSFRVLLAPGANPDEVRKEIQIRMAKYIDFRFWKTGQLVEWDNLLEIVKSTPGVLYVPDTYFTPNSDVQIQNGKLPRLRGFLMLDTDGNILSDIQGNLIPTFYPSNPDFSLQATILANL